jgi:limonene-1,2-epoxide hydrolase
MTPNKDPIKAVEEFMDRWTINWDEHLQSYRDMLTEDCSWENEGWPAAVGPDEAIEKILIPCREMLGLDTLEVITTEICYDEKSHLVWTERIDTIIDKDGNKRPEGVDIAGIMWLAPDNRIRRWREYLNPNVPIGWLSDEQRAAMGL